MWIVWTGGNDRFWDGMTGLHLRRLRPAEDRRLRSRPSRSTATSAGTISAWSTSRASTPPTAPDPKRFGLLLDVRARRIARPIRSRTRPNIPASRSARAARPCPVGSLLRLCHRHRRPAAVPQSGLRRGRGREAGTPSAITPTRATTTTRTWCGPTASACPAASAMSGPSPMHPPADPAHPQWADLSSTVGAQYMWVDRLFIYNARRRQLHVPARAHLPAGRDGHLAGLDRQHQQPAHDERGLQPRRRGSSMALRWGQRDAGRRRAQQQAVQRLRRQRPADRSSSRSRTRSGRRTC